MSTSKSGIEWTDRTWNPVRGCWPVSAGCANCYAATMASRFSGEGQPYEGLAKGGKWTGKVRCIEAALEEPLHWKKPARIFVNSMSDLFHEDVPDRFIAQVFSTIYQCPRHTFMILTKRPERMAEWMTGLKGREAFGWAEGAYKHVWLGVSVENQQAADERIPFLLQTPAAVRFLSCEPLLGPVDLNATPAGDVLCRCDGCMSMTPDTRLDWVIVGGESGPKARPMHPEWARGLRDQCAAAGVPYFFKQHGEWTAETVPGTGPDLSELAPNQLVAWGDGKTNHTRYTRVGKHAAGRLLDGRTWDECPETETTSK